MKIDKAARKRARIRSGLLSSVAALSVALTGCTASNTPAVDPQVTASVSELSVLPPDVDMARSVLRGKCMLRVGYDVPLETVIAAPSRAQSGSVVGIWSNENQARASGYLSTYLGDSVSPFDSFLDRLPASDHAAYNDALHGDGTSIVEYVTDSGMTFGRSDEGCEAESDVAIFGSLEDAISVELFVNEINGQMSGKGSSLSISEEVTGYESCMQDKGYEVNGIGADELAGELIGQYRTYGEAPNPEEQNLAVTDYQCQQTSELSRTVSEQSSALIADWLTQNERRILDLRETLRSSVQRSQAVINAAQ